MDKILQNLKAVIGSNIDRRIVVLAGVEEVARIEHGKLFIKTSACARCGECCKRVPAHWKWGLNADGHCRMLRWEAGQAYCLDAVFPFGCLTGDEAGKEHCSVKWKEINGE